MNLTNAAVISLLAIVAPLVTRALRKGNVPVIVVELLLGLAFGPYLIGWLNVDGAVRTLSLLGLTFLFFLAGLEVDLQQIRGLVLVRALSGYGIGLAIAYALCAGLAAAGLLQAPMLVAIAFSATGLGLVVPILTDAHLLRTPPGANLIASASVAEFSAVLLLTITFSTGGSPARSVAALTALAALAIGITFIGRRLGQSSRITRIIDVLSGGTVQLRVRLSVALVISFAALAQVGGLEVVLGAFFAGGVLNMVDSSMRDPSFRARLDGLGYGLLIPVFFVASGALLDFSTLSLWPDALVLVPLLLVVLLVSRATPELLLRVGDGLQVRVGSGLLCATSLPFIVTASQIGESTGRLTPSTASAMTITGLVGVIVFPAIGVPLLRRVVPVNE